MKVVVTVTSVYDFPDDVAIEDLTGGDGAAGRHIVINGRNFLPTIDFWDADNEEDGMDDVYEVLDDSLMSEEYTIIDVDGPADD